MSSTHLNPFPGCTRYELPACEENERIATLADGIAAASGCEPRVAQIAAGALIQFPEAPDHGLSGYASSLEYERLNNQARLAIRTWKEAQAAFALIGRAA